MLFGENVIISCSYLLQVVTGDWDVVKIEDLY